MWPPWFHNLTSDAYKTGRPHRAAPTGTSVLSQNRYVNPTFATVRSR
jgi:hypothetical protein